MRSLACSVLAAAACGGAVGGTVSGRVSCNIIEAGASAPSSCQEWELVHSGDSAVYRSACGQLAQPPTETSAFDATGGCDLTSAVGGCQNSGQTPLITTWFYDPYYTYGAVAAACRDNVVSP